MVPPRWVTMVATRVFSASTAVSSRFGSSTTINSYSRTCLLSTFLWVCSPLRVGGGRKESAKYNSRFSPRRLLLEVPRRMRRAPAKSYSLLPAVALFLPRIAAHVVAVLLPEAWPVAGHELQAADPLGALPEVEVRHEQPQRPAVLGRDGLAVPRVHQHVLGPHEVLEAEVGGEAVLGFDHYVRGRRLQRNQLHDLRDRDAFPGAIEQRPAGHAVHVLLHRLAGQLLELLVAELDRLLDEAFEREIPGVQFDLGHAAVVQHRPLLGQILARRQAIGHGALTFAQLAA